MATDLQKALYGDPPPAAREIAARVDLSRIAGSFAFTARVAVIIQNPEAFTAMVEALQRVSTLQRKVLLHRLATAMHARCRP